MTKSPFPGMDPYIEEVGFLWPDFHSKLIREIERALSGALPDRYFIQTGERSYIVLAGIDEKEKNAFLPDVGVFTPRRGEPQRQAEGVAVEELQGDADVVTMRAFIDEHCRENFIEIYEAAPEVRLVTCIEVLSPSNKRPGTEGWEVYLRKRNSLLLGSANFVEIDLLRGGRRMPMAEPWPTSPYYLLVARKSRAPYCRVSRAGYRQPLPIIPVPLSPPDADFMLALQPTVDAIYARSRYGMRLDYTKPLAPPLSPEDARWLSEQLAKQP
jgi:hypothetical protein